MHRIAKLHYITQEVKGFSHALLAEEACKGGVNWVQLRLKNKSEEECLQIAKEVKSICKKYKAKLIINDNVMLAKAINADGVHLGKTDIPVKQAREILGINFIIGGTANTPDDVERLNAEGVDYIGLGPFRFTVTKENLSPVLGLEGIGGASKRARIPVIAIGGIKEEDVKEIMGIGVYGIAVSSGINLAVDRAGAAKKFIKVINDFGVFSKRASLHASGGQGVGPFSISRITKRNIIPYNPSLKEFARQLRSNSTPAEKLLWNELKNKKVQELDFDRQRPIDNYIVDFYCKELKLAIEIDGYSHKFKIEGDIERQKKLESLGVKFIRFTEKSVKEDIRNTVRSIEITVDDMKHTNTQFLTDPCPPQAEG